MLLSSVGEGWEEGTQEGISKVADRFAKSGEDTSATKMLLNAFDLSKYSKEDWEEIGDAAKNAFIIGMGTGGVHAIANNGGEIIGSTIDAVNKKRTENAFIRAWTDAINKNTTNINDGGERYSLIIKYSDGSSTELSDARSLTNQEAIGYLNQAKEGSLRRETYIPVRKDTPRVLIDTLAKHGVQVDNLSLVMQVGKAQQAMGVENLSSQTNKRNSKRKHNLSPSEVMEIINNLDHPTEIVLQTNRVRNDGTPLPDNIAVFVEYNENGKEGLAVVEFDSSIDGEFIGDNGDKKYHTVVTVFAPDTERDGLSYDYMEELISNPNNQALEIERGQPTESATGEKIPNTFEDLPSFDKSIPQIESSVKENDFTNSDTIGVVRDEYTATLDEAVVNELDEVARRLGLRVEFTDGIESNKSADASIKGNVVKIDKNTKRPILKLMGHEITHHLQKMSPEAYAKFEKLALKRIGDESVIDTYLRYKSAGVKDIDTKAAIEEAVADYAGALVYDGKVLDKFISDNKRDKGILGTVRSAVAYLKDKLTGKSKAQAQVAETKLTNAINNVNLENENTAQTDGERFYIGDEVGVDMSEDQRYEILKDKKIQPQTIEIDEAFDIDIDFLENNIKSIVEKPLIKKLNELGYTRKYKTDKIDVDFELTNAGLKKSLHSQGNYYGGNFGDFAKIVLNLQKLLDNSVLIDVHTDKAKGTSRENERLKRVYVLFSAFSEDTSITPVQFEIKEYIDNNNRLYLTVALTKIETSVKGNTAFDENQTRTYLVPVSEYSLAEIFSKINTADKNFLKYIPDQFLDEEQKAAKREALLAEDKKYGRDTEERYSIKLPETDADTQNSDIAELLDMLDNEEASEATKLKLAELREKYGVIPKGEKPFRDVELPERTAEDKYVSQTVRTILEAKATPEIALKPIEALVAEGEFSYDRYTDKAAQADAEAIIKRKGWAIALGDWLKWSRNGFISKQNTALGWKLYNNSVNSGDMETALEILSIIANNQRNAAQALQATRILKKLSPETQLYQVQRSVESLQNEINARHRKGGDAELKINEALARQFMEAETQEARDTCLLYVFSMVYSSQMRD